MNNIDETVQCLSACGCTPEEIAQYQAVLRQGIPLDGVRFLKRHRRKLMDEVHKLQKQIDCVDFLIQKTT